MVANVVPVTALMSVVWLTPDTGVMPQPMTRAGRSLQNTGYSMSIVSLSWCHLNVHNRLSYATHTSGGSPVPAIKYQSPPCLLPQYRAASAHGVALDNGRHSDRVGPCPSPANQRLCLHPAIHVAAILATCGQRDPEVLVCDDPRAVCGQRLCGLLPLRGEQEGRVGVQKAA